MADFTKHSLENAPEPAKKAMEKANQAFGMVPNIIGYMAGAPALANAYMQVSDLFTNHTTLTPVEQNAVLLSVSFENDCEYCMAAHSAGAKQAGMDDDILEAFRTGEKIKDEKLEALRTYVWRVMQKKGYIGDDALQEFLNAGFTKQQSLEVIVGIGQKTMSNYMNHVVGTELDDAMKDFAWSKDMKKAEPATA